MRVMAQTATTQAATTETTALAGGLDQAQTGKDAATKTGEGADPKAAPAAKAGEAPKTEVKPEEKKAEELKYEFKTPEGVELDKELLGKFEALAKESGIKPDAAQKVLDFHLANQKAAAEKAEADDKALWTAWKKAAAEDKEYGGKDFEANKKLAQKAVVHLVGGNISPEMKELLSGPMGDHPEFVRLMVRVGKALAEDSIGGSLKGAARSDPQADYARMFPTMFKQE